MAVVTTVTVRFTNGRTKEFHFEGVDVPSEFIRRVTPLITDIASSVIGVDAHFEYMDVNYEIGVAMDKIKAHDHKNMKDVQEWRRDH